MDKSKLEDGLYAVLNTEKGEITLSLAYREVPMTVSNFVGLAEGSLNIQNPGKPFYDGLTFHRVVDNFMIQGGCPKGNGTGGPGYAFPDEFNDSLKHDRPGILSMANAGPRTNGSQFFITHVPTPWLNGKHAVFGHVVEGQDVVSRIAQGDVIRKVEIVRIGKEAEGFIVSRETFARLVEAAERKDMEREAAEIKAITQEIRNRWPHAQKTGSGLYMDIVKSGKGGKSPKYGQEVTVNYQGSLMNGKIFDSSYQRGPVSFRIGEVIEGWNEALQTMTVGEKATLIIPPQLGYGTTGYPGLIPPNSYLVFDVELIRF